ncbi:MerR family transcriptional regulator [Pseudomonas japonica]|uniref:DNA-binding transcriptional regulator, MerR family n=1 Tax=Pseudomonas japonica TaxID=256466 RepID=A0A239F3Y2_9PSED|nr:MerR family transcriptional regulator [Pseudomonas japonica]SNS50814.1 DNA-binding transcriptional regulator, MerR family [Pseudomonas japonica]
MFIGRIAELTGCTPKAIRLYEQLGLIDEPERDGRYRVYNAHHLEMVHLIRRAQSAGFKLAEMSPLIEAKNRLKSFPLAMANEAVEAKRRQVGQQIAELQTLDLHLIELKKQMNSLFAQPPGTCPIKAETLSRQGR